MTLPSQKYTIPVLLIVWFFIWGICPWNSSSAVAQPAEAAHAAHGHHGMDDTHHASKGTEHSCSGAISYSQNNLKTDQALLASSPTQVPTLTDPTVSSNQNSGFFKLVIERSTLPKIMTEFYQLYSIYRI